MNPFRIVTALTLLSGCTTPEEHEREALMSQIERQVQLPQGARPLSEYARYYAESDNGEVIAVYLTPFNYEIRPGDTCEEVLENLTTRKVPCEPIPKREWDMPAGERRWIEQERDLPFINDGGCMQVTVVFDKATSTVKSARCNGVA